MTQTLLDDTVIPPLGLGTWKLVGEEGYRAIRTALTLGYRHLDTASAYGNEEVVGRAVRDALRAGELTREELFLTTKAWRDEQGSVETPAACRRSLDRLGVEYVDLYLVHWPHARLGRYLAAAEAIVGLREEGLVRFFGVANFPAEELREVVEKVGAVPATNQVELHPGFSQAPLRALHDELGVRTVAWSPLGRGQLLEHPLLVRIADEVGATPAQVALRWALDLGCVVIPRSGHPERLARNLEAAEVSLSEGHILAISALDEAAGAGRMFEDPRYF